MDFLPGQTVLDFVNQELLDHRYSTVAYVDSAERRDIVYQMANILAYFHHNNYVHLDFTLENLMFNEFNQVVVIDLGLSQYCPESFNVSIYSGKRIYLPPETYVPQTAFDGTKRDIWSLGVCIYTLYSGNYFLIGNETIQQACKSLKYGFDYYLQSHYPLGLKWPKQLKSILFNYIIDLIGKCLTINPEKRPTIDEVLNHEWIKDKSNSTFAFIDRIKRSVKHAVKPVLTKRSSLFFKNPKKISPDASDIESIIYIIL